MLTCSNTLLENVAKHWPRNTYEHTKHHAHLSASRLHEDLESTSTNVIPPPKASIQGTAHASLLDTSTAQTHKSTQQQSRRIYQFHVSYDIQYLLLGARWLLLLLPLSRMGCSCPSRPLGRHPRPRAGTGDGTHLPPPRAGASGNRTSLHPLLLMRATAASGGGGRGGGSRIVVHLHLRLIAPRYLLVVELRLFRGGRRGGAERRIHLDDTVGQKREEDGRMGRQERRYEETLASQRRKACSLAG